MNPIHENQYFVLPLMHSGKKYLFTKSDLTNIIESALINSPFIFSEPLPIKNPYNNLIFDKSHLYTIYFFMKHRMFVLPAIFHQYFLYNFHLKLFRNNNEALIRKMHILSMIKSNNYIKMQSDISSMIQYHNLRRRSAFKHIQIHPEFPVDILIRAMKPFLHLFYTSIYALDITEKSAASIELKKQLIIFQKASPLFGHKIKVSSSRICTDPSSRNPVYNIQYKNYVTSPYSNNYAACHCEIVEDDYDSSVDIIPIPSILHVNMLPPIPPVIFHDSEDGEDGEDGEDDEDDEVDEDGEDDEVTEDGEDDEVTEDANATGEVSEDDNTLPIEICGDWLTDESGDDL
jgi:hypothetical protein